MAVARLSHIKREVEVRGERESRAEERMHDLELHHLSQVRQRQPPAVGVGMVVNFIVR